MGACWPVSAGILPASSFLPEVYPLTSQLCMVQAAGKDVYMVLEPCVCACTACNTCVLCGTVVNFLDTLCSLMGDWIWAQCTPVWM